MQNVLVYAKTAATRQLYHQTLSRRDMETYRAKDLAEVFLLLATFAIDTIILVDEGSILELNLILEVILKKYKKKRIILISTTRDVPAGVECYGSTHDFLALWE